MFLFLNFPLFLPKFNWIESALYSSLDALPLSSVLGLWILKYHFFNLQILLPLHPLFPSSWKYCLIFYYFLHCNAFCSLNCFLIVCRYRFHRFSKFVISFIPSFWLLSSLTTDTSNPLVHSLQIKWPGWFYYILWPSCQSQFK